MKPTTISLALVDDHQLVRGGIKLLLENFKDFKVDFVASNGKEFLELLASSTKQPEIALIDVSMPMMDGFETTRRIKELYPQVKIISLSVHDDEKTVNEMIECGANAYLLKDAAPDTVRNTILQVQQNGYFYDELVIQSFLKNKNQLKKNNTRNASFDFAAELTAREIEFIKNCCTEMTYKEIADKMSITPRTVDGYRESVFSKLNLKSRTGVVLFAINQKLFGFSE